MRNNMMQLDKSFISEIHIIDTAIDLLFGGQSIAKCRSFILSEYEIDVHKLDELLERANRKARQCDTEMHGSVRF
jgi:hypothetical protein